MGAAQARGMMGGEGPLLSPGGTPANPQMAIAMQQMMAGQQLLASGIALAGYNPNAQNSAAHMVGVAGTQAGMAGAMGGAVSYPTASSGGAIPNSYAANSYLGSPPAPGAHAGAAMGGFPRAVYGSMTAEQAYGMAAMGGPTGKHARTRCSRRAPPLPHPSFTPFAPAISGSASLLSAHMIGPLSPFAFSPPSPGCVSPVLARMQPTTARWSPPPTEVWAPTPRSWAAGPLSSWPAALPLR